MPDHPPVLATIGVGMLLGAVVMLAILTLGSEYGAWWALAGGAP